MKAIVVTAAGRLVYWGCAALTLVGVAALYGQSEGLIRFPAVWTARPALLGSSAPEAHYAPREDLEPIDVALIDGAAETIDMAAYVLTDVPVIEALAEAAARGVKGGCFASPLPTPRPAGSARRSLPCRTRQTSRSGSKRERTSCT